MSLPPHLSFQFHIFAMCVTLLQCAAIAKCTLHATDRFSKFDSPPTPFIPPPLLHAPFPSLSRLVPLLSVSRTHISSVSRTHISSVSRTHIFRQPKETLFIHTSHGYLNVSKREREREGEGERGRRGERGRM